MTFVGDLAHHYARTRKKLYGKQPLPTVKVSWSEPPPRRPPEPQKAKLRWHTPDCWPLHPMEMLAGNDLTSIDPALLRTDVERAVFIMQAIEYRPGMSVGLTALKATASAFGLPVAQLRSRSRPVALSRARGIGMAVAHRCSRCSLPEVGRAFCKDHTTVLHATRKYAALVAEAEAEYQKLKAKELRCDQA